MKFLAAKLDENGATTLAAEHGDPFRVRTRSGLTIPIETCPDPHEPTSLVSMAAPRWAVDHAVASVVTLDHQRESIRKDGHLSDAGKHAKFSAPRAQALHMIATVSSTLADHESKVIKRDSERYGVPAIGPQSFGEALRDFEIRSVVRSLRGDERGQMIQRIGKGEDVDLLLATLRSPLSDPSLHEVATVAWRELKDRSDPTGRAELDLALANIEWAKRCFGHIAGNVRRILSIDNEPFDRSQLYELVRDADSATGKLSAGAGLFGFTQREAANFELHIKRRAAA
jgi:hypothetical protein